MDDGEPESNDDNNDQVPGDPVSGLHVPGGPWGGCGSKRPIGLVAFIFMNLHVKCPIISAKDGGDAESYLLCSNCWINSPKVWQKIQKVVGFASLQVVIVPYVTNQ